MVTAGQPLPLNEGLNPAWVEEITNFNNAVVTPTFGNADKTALSESEWLTILEKFAPYEAWSDKKMGSAVEKLELARIKEILTGTY